MEQYWEHGWYYLAAGQSMDIVISFGDCDPRDCNS